MCIRDSVRVGLLCGNGKFCSVYLGRDIDGQRGDASGFFVLGYQRGIGICGVFGTLGSVSYTHLDDQRIGEKRHEYMALKHPSVNVEAEMAFRNKAVVDSLEGNSLIHPLTTPVIVVDKTNTKCRRCV